MGAQYAEPVLIADYLAQLHEHGTALGDGAQRVGLDVDVPSCPGWAVRDLVAHVAVVHRWAIQCLSSPPGGGRVPWPAPPASDLLEAYRSGHAELLDLLQRIPDDLQVWAFLPAPSPKAFWARRQAHETAIHRVDVERTAGRALQFEPQFAVDGIDELLTGFLARPRSTLLADPPTTLLIEATDADVWWHVTIGPTERVVRSGGERFAAATVRASASDLYQSLWNREPAAAVEHTGDPAVTRLWRERAGI